MRTVGFPAHRMEEDLFQGDIQDYFENGNLYERCYFQWCLVQCLVFEKHLLLEMNFQLEKSPADCLNLEYSRQTTKVLERAVNAVIKGALIKSICFTQSTTVEELKTILKYLSVPRSSVVKSVTGSAPSSSRTTWISHRPVFSITSLTYPTVSAFSLDRSPGSPRPHVLLRGGRSVHRFSLSVFISALHSV